MNEEHWHMHLTVSYPLLIERYKATLIDVAVQFGAMILVMLLAQAASEPSVFIVPAVLAIPLLYEPLLIRYSCTLGQYIMDIRVHDGHDPFRRVTLWQSYLRFFVKYLLGWASFITIHNNEQKRAIHDFASNSVVIHRKCLE